MKWPLFFWVSAEKFEKQNLTFKFRDFENTANHEVTWEALSFSAAGTCSTTRGLPSSLHKAARYILGLPKVGFTEIISAFLDDMLRATGLKSLSGTVRKDAILNLGNSLSQKNWPPSIWVARTSTLVGNSELFVIQYFLFTKNSSFRIVFGRI